MTDRDLVSIASPLLSAKIDPFGAQLFELRDAQGRDLLWSGDPAVWNGRAPILFPIVGALAGDTLRLGDQTFTMEKHGFGRRRLFEVVDHGPASATFRLRPDPATLAMYPFQFELDLTFSIDGAVLTTEVVVKNTGAEVMPASFGFHPALRWPLPYGQPRSAHHIRFEHPEPKPVRRIDRAGLVLPEPFPTPVAGAALALADDLFEADVVIFDDIESRKVIYGADQGPHLEMAFPDTPRLGVWTKPGAGYVCIEPWQGVADPQGFTGDFRSKPGVFEVQPGGQHRILMTIAFVDA